SSCHHLALKSFGAFDYARCHYESARCFVRRCVLISAEHKYLEFKLTDTGDIDKVLPKKGYLTPYLAYHCACNVDLVQEASVEARQHLDAVAKHAQGSAQHFDTLKAFFLASPAPALDELDDIRRATDLARCARKAAL
ncbi:hypothetical protein C8F01DRAFT_1360510, partial [Mycena amicta]